MRLKAALKHGITFTGTISYRAALTIRLTINRAAAHKLGIAPTLARAAIHTRPGQLTVSVHLPAGTAHAIRRRHLHRLRFTWAASADERRAAGVGTLG